MMMKIIQSENESQQWHKRSDQPASFSLKLKKEYIKLYFKSTSLSVT
jgi:hypothetical protein